MTHNDLHDKLNGFSESSWLLDQIKYLYFTYTLNNNLVDLLVE